MGKSRLKNSIKNLQAAWIGQFLNVFAKFVMRRFFVRYISDDYLWLKLDIWDYSRIPFNLYGQICLPYAAVWFVLSADCGGYPRCAGENGLFPEKQGLQQECIQTVSYGYDPDVGRFTTDLRSGIFAG